MLHLCSQHPGPHLVDRGSKLGLLQLPHDPKGCGQRQTNAAPDVPLLWPLPPPPPSMLPFSL
jgi:hypothetical protein